MHRATLAPILAVLHATAACSGAARSPGGSAGGGPAAACLPLAEAQERALAGGQRNLERYQQALEAKGLAPITLEEKEEVSVRDGAAPDEVVTREEGGRQVRYLIGPAVHRACNFDPRGWSLVRNASGELYRVERRPKVLQPDTLTACGCRVESGRACGGAAVNPYAAGLYPIPDGLEYKGPVAIEYDHEAESVLFTGRLARGKGCPPPEPPPP